MTAEATPASVRGDFSGATLQSDGVTARMDRDAGGGYRMTFERAGQAPRVAAVVRTVGSRRYQQYLAREGDTYWRLPVAYQIEEQRWFPMTSAFLFSDPDPSSGAVLSPVADARPVFGGGDFDRHVARWNDNCVFCHNVAPNPGRDPVSGSFATSVAELGVACEACHGFKLSVFLDDQLRHTLLRLAHAHGVVLALVVLAFGGGAAALYGDAPPAAARWTGRLIRIGAAVIPLGFALSAISPHEGDPGAAVWLVPAGALALIAGLVRAAARAWTAGSAGAAGSAGSD